ncbi:MAG: hypothetical protein HN976_36580 [Lentisphaerae bacterium]|nr:hypothetical protein [Lentisphaerota bacterium]
MIHTRDFSGFVGKEGTAMITLRTGSFHWDIDDAGNSVSLRGAADGAECLDRRAPIAILRRGQGDVFPVEANLRGSDLCVTFSDNSKLTLATQCCAKHLVLTVAAVEAAAYERIDFIDVPLTLEPVAEPDAFCMGAVSRTLQTRVDAVPGPQSHLNAACYPNLGAVGASAAVVGVRFCELRSALQTIVSEAPDLPHSPLGGPWALDAPENRNSYLFGIATEETVDEWIKLCHDVGIGQLHFCGGGAFPMGDYDPNPALFPRGLDSVRAVVDKLHGAGLQAGVHTLSFSIGKNSRYVTPVPDPRLGAANVLTLAGDLSAEADIVPVLEPTAHMPRIANYSSRTSVTLMIEEELIDYDGIQDSPPYALTKCKRGAYGTTASAHPAGARIKHLKACWGMFAPDGEEGLFSEITGNISNLINKAGFDMVYLDGLDGAHILRGEEFRWYYGGRFAFEVFKALDRPIIMEMAAFLHHLWFVRSRMGAWDHASRGHKHFIDLHCRSNQNFKRIFLPGHLGWWAPRTTSGTKDDSTFPDDVAYLCTKALGDNIGFSLQGVGLESCERVPNLQQVAPIFRRYETVRKSGIVPESVREQLAIPGAEFELDDSDPGAPLFFPLKRHVHHTDLPGEGGPRWEVVSEDEEQSPWLRLEAVWSAADYDSPEGVTLAEFADEGEFADNGPVLCRVNSGEDYEYSSAAPGMNASLSIVQGGAPAGGPAARFCAHREASDGLVFSSAPDDEFSILHHGERFHRSRKASWVRIGKHFGSLLDITGQQALGVWIKGDGKGEWLNLQMRGQGRFFTYSDFYVPIDFTGWRYVELLEPDCDRFDELSWPYARAVYKLHRHGVEYESVVALHVWLNGVAEGDDVEVMLGAVRALPVVTNRFIQPTVVINGEAVTFPIEMVSGHRLEVSGIEGTVFDQQGKKLETFQLSGSIPTLSPGPNAIAFETKSAFPRPRARVSLVTRNPDPVR